MQKNIVDEVFPVTLKILSDLIKFQTVSGTSNVKLINYFISNRELLIDKCRNFSLNNISIKIGSTKLSKIYKKTFIINK